MKIRLVPYMIFILVVAMTSAGCVDTELTLDTFSDDFYEVSSECNKNIALREDCVYATTSATEVTSGWTGEQASLYDANTGMLRAYSNMLYNMDKTVELVVSSPIINNIDDNGETFLYAQSVADLWMTHNDYAVRYHTTTPEDSDNDDSSELILENEYETNENGQTYGVAISAEVIGYEPDLILCTNDEGIQGYVKSKDLVPEINSPEEAVRYMEGLDSVDEPITIPIYDVSGEMILGEFRLK